MSPYMSVCTLILPKCLPLPPITTRPLKPHLLGHWAFVLQMAGLGPLIILAHLPTFLIVTEVFPGPPRLPLAPLDGVPQSGKAWSLL